MHPLTPWHAPLCTLCNAAIRKSPRTALYIRLLLYRTLAAVDGLFQSSREHDRHLDVAIKDPLGSHGPAQEHRNAGEEEDGLLAHALDLVVPVSLGGLLGEAEALEGMGLEGPRGGAQRHHDGEGPPGSDAGSSGNHVD